MRIIIYRESWAFILFYVMFVWTTIKNVLHHSCIIGINVKWQNLFTLYYIDFHRLLIITRRIRLNKYIQNCEMYLKILFWQFYIHMFSVSNDRNKKQYNIDRILYLLNFDICVYIIFIYCSHHLFDEGFFYTKGSLVLFDLNQHKCCNAPVWFGFTFFQYNFTIS